MTLPNFKFSPNRAHKWLAIQINNVKFGGFLLCTQKCHLSDLNCGQETDLFELVGKNYGAKTGFNKYAFFGN